MATIVPQHVVRGTTPLFGDHPDQVQHLLRSEGRATHRYRLHVAVPLAASRRAAAHAEALEGPL
eukprot:CAMPEP_0183511588 /NCGR_PEP_ID=MMETSP0371-20130417/10994_1 /TAXON_ID=268820 /ORGANISM="Peridinium aciculiferum, Strain PAER-2" /LENGTH=63 /DNA_ID=CAMNT_0025708527 /DNA_START=936 /DNA_END=1123 /DNA_ORIENTATION=+